MAVVAGGDGSLMRLALDMSKANVDVKKVVFTVLPFGTGNDLARQLNWGGSQSVLQLTSDPLGENAKEPEVAR